MSYSRISELAARIGEATNSVDAYLKSKQLPSPSFHEDGPVDFGIEAAEVEKARLVALDSSWELYHLLLGPALCLRPVLNGVSLQAIYKYDIASKVPLHGEISYEDLSNDCGLDVPNLRRALRFAMVYHYTFREPRNGFVAHTAASRKLAEDPLARAGLGYMFDEVWQSFARTIEAKQAFGSDHPEKSGWTLAQQTEEPVWSYYASHPEMAQRFGRAIASSTNDIGNSPNFLVNSYPWKSVGDGLGTVVDVGGGKGNISAAIAKAVPGLHFIVQDMSAIIEGSESSISHEIADRVDFMAHDFFSPQTVNANVYLFRNIFHNWSDAKVIQILEATTPALKPGSRIVVNDYLVPEANSMIPRVEREIRAMDMIMWTLFNAREREAEDWRTLFRQADPRYGEIKIWTPEGASLAIIEAEWTPGNDR